MARVQVLFRDLVLRFETSEKVPAEAAAEILAEQVIAGNCVLTRWDNAVEQWIVRLNRLREWMPELELPAIGADERRAIIEQICHGASSYREIKEREVWPCGEVMAFSGAAGTRGSNSRPSASRCRTEENGRSFMTRRCRRLSRRGFRSFTGSRKV